MKTGFFNTSRYGQVHYHAIGVLPPHMDTAATDDQQRNKKKSSPQKTISISSSSSIEAERSPNKQDISSSQKSHHHVVNHHVILFLHNLFAGASARDCHGLMHEIYALLESSPPPPASQSSPFSFLQQQQQHNVHAHQQTSSFSMRNETQQQAEKVMDKKEEDQKESDHTNSTSTAAFDSVNSHCSHNTTSASSSCSESKKGGDVKKVPQATINYDYHASTDNNIGINKSNAPRRQNSAVLSYHFPPQGPDFPYAFNTTTGMESATAEPLQEQPPCCVAPVVEFCMLALDFPGYGKTPIYKKKKNSLPHTSTCSVSGRNEGGKSTTTTTNVYVEFVKDIMESIFPHNASSSSTNNKNATTNINHLAIVAEGASAGVVFQVFSTTKAVNAPLPDALLLHQPNCLDWPATAAALSNHPILLMYDTSDVSRPLSIGRKLRKMLRQAKWITYASKKYPDWLVDNQAITYVDFLRKVIPATRQESCRHEKIALNADAVDPKNDGHQGEIMWKAPTATANSTTILCMKAATDDDDDHAAKNVEQKNCGRNVALSGGGVSLSHTIPRGAIITKSKCCPSCHQRLTPISEDGETKKGKIMSSEESNRQQWICDVCCSKPRSSSSYSSLSMNSKRSIHNRFRCEQCDFDVCLDCWNFGGERVLYHRCLYDHLDFNDNVDEGGRVARNDENNAAENDGNISKKKKWNEEEGGEEEQNKNKKRCHVMAPRQVQLLLNDDKRRAYDSDMQEKMMTMHCCQCGFLLSEKALQSNSCNPRTFEVPGAENRDDEQKEDAPVVSVRAMQCQVCADVFMCLSCLQKTKASSSVVKAKKNSSLSSAAFASCCSSDDRHHEIQVRGGDIAKDGAVGLNSKSSSSSALLQIKYQDSKALSSNNVAAKHENNEEDQQKFVTGGAGSSQFDSTEHCCAICCELLCFPIQLPVCSHTFCLLCCVDWLTYNAICPCCRMELPLTFLQQLRKLVESEKFVKAALEFSSPISPSKIGEGRKREEENNDKNPMATSSAAYFVEVVLKKFLAQEIYEQLCAPPSSSSSATRKGGLFTRQEEEKEDKRENDDNDHAHLDHGGGKKDSNKTTTAAALVLRSPPSSSSQRILQFQKRIMAFQQEVLRRSRVLRITFEYGSTCKRMSQCANKPLYEYTVWLKVKAVKYPSSFVASFSSQQHVQNNSTTTTSTEVQQEEEDNEQRQQMPPVKKSTKMDKKKKTDINNMLTANEPITAKSLLSKVIFRVEPEFYISADRCPQHVIRSDPFQITLKGNIPPCIEIQPLWKASSVLGRRSPIVNSGASTQKLLHQVVFADGPRGSVSRCFVEEIQL